MRPAANPATALCLELAAEYHVGGHLCTQNRAARHFDLSVPRKIAPYDKMGGKIVVRALKHYVFGSENARLTRERRERVLRTTTTSPDGPFRLLQCRTDATNAG